MGEAEIAARLRAEGMDPAPWSNGPGDTYAPHSHAYDKVLVCARGSIELGLPAHGRTVRLDPGDRLDLPAGTEHRALVGPDGVTCLEAHRAPGSLAPQPVRRADGAW